MLFNHGETLAIMFFKHHLSLGFPLDENALQRLAAFWVNVLGFCDSDNLYSHNLLTGFTHASSFGKDFRITRCHLANYFWYELQDLF